MATLDGFQDSTSQSSRIGIVLMNKQIKQRYGNLNRCSAIKDKAKKE